MSNPPRVPRLRFPGFEGEWRIKRLGSIGETINGLTYSPKNIRRSGTLVLRSSNIQNGQLDLNDCVFVDSALKFNQSLKGDILICVRNGSTRLIGKNIYLEKQLQNTTHGAFMTVYRSKNNRFIKQLLSSPSYYKRVHIDLGARINSINTSQLLAYRFYMPDDDEQQKIADFLVAVDTKLIALEQKVVKLETYKRGVMQQLFSQKIRFTRPDGSQYPAWEIKRAGEVFTNLSNRQHTDNLPILSVTQDDGVVRRDALVRKIDQSEASIKSYKVIEPQDFVISLRSFQGGIEMSLLRGLSSPAYTVIRGGQMIHPPMYRHYFKRDEFISKLNSTVIGIRDGKQISYGPFSILKLPVPCIGEQQKIAAFLDSVSKKIDLAKAELAEAKRFKQSLLQRMFI